MNVINAACSWYLEYEDSKWINRWWCWIRDELIVWRLGWSRDNANDNGNDNGAEDLDEDIDGDDDDMDGDEDDENDEDDDRWDDDVVVVAGALAVAAGDDDDDTGELKASDRLIVEGLIAGDIGDEKNVLLFPLINMFDLAVCVGDRTENGLTLLRGIIIDDDPNDVSAWLMGDNNSLLVVALMKGDVGIVAEWWVEVRCCDDDDIDGGDDGAVCVSICVLLIILFDVMELISDLMGDEENMGRSCCIFVPLNVPNAPLLAAKNAEGDS